MRVILTRLGPEELAMMTVCARCDLTATRAWTFTPAKAEEVDMIAAILLVCGGVNEGFTVGASMARDRHFTQYTPAKHHSQESISV